MVTHSCLGNPMDRGAWWATVRGVARKYDWAQVHNVLYLRPYQSSVLHTAVCMCQSQEKYVWCILTWFLFPSHCWEHEGAFLWFLLWEPGWDPGDKSCKAVGACYDGVPLEILAIRLVYMEHLGDSNITAEVFPSLAPTESAPGGCRFLYLLGWVSGLVSSGCPVAPLPLSLHPRELLNFQSVKLWLTRTEGQLPNSLLEEPEIWCPILSCKHIITTRFKRFRNFPGGLVVMTLHFHCRGHRFDPWSGNQDPTCLEVWPINK